MRGTGYKLLWLMLLVLTTGACGRQTNLKTAADGNSADAVRSGQTLLITDSLLATGGTDTVRLGRMGAGEIVQRRLWIENATHQSLVLSDYERSCGCTTLEFEREPFAPGTAKQVTLRFDSDGEWGWQLKMIHLKFGGRSKPLRLLIEAEVK